MAHRLMSHRCHGAAIAEGSAIAEISPCHSVDKVCQERAYRGDTQAHTLSPQAVSGKLQGRAYFRCPVSGLGDLRHAHGPAFGRNFLRFLPSTLQGLLWGRVTAPEKASAILLGSLRKFGVPYFGVLENKDPTI